MESVTREIDSALKVLSISTESFRLLPKTESELLFKDLLEEFVANGDRHWWWEDFTGPEYSVNFRDGKGYTRITKITPEPNACVWLVVEDTALPFFPIYEATPKDIERVIGECYGFEYYIIPKSKEWLLCENHHSRMIGVGKKVIERMQAYNA